MKPSQAETVKRCEPIGCVCDFQTLDVWYILLNFESLYSSKGGFFNDRCKNHSHQIGTYVLYAYVHVYMCLKWYEDYVVYRDKGGAIGVRVHRSTTHGQRPAIRNKYQVVSSLCHEI